MNGFSVDDITFRNARKQSDIELEIAKEEGENTQTQVKGGAPVSHTKEQVINFLNNEIEETTIPSRRRIFKHIIRCLNDREILKAKVNSLEEKLNRYTSIEDKPDDLET